MSAAAALIIGIVFLLIARILYFSSVPVKPTVFCGDPKFLESVFKYCPCLQEIYRPPGLWGRSGHLQTIIHGLFGRVKVPYVMGERWTCTIYDGATATYDIYESCIKDPDKEDILLLVCPGIANSSESVYVQTFVANALDNGYHCAVLNHLGSVADVKLTSPRIFTYGGTEEFHQLALHMARRYPAHKMVAIGFSMGGNIITKYLGEKSRERPVNLVAGVSICQGYDALRVQPILIWENIRRLYFLVISETVKDVIRRYREVLLAEAVVRKHHIEERRLFAAQTLVELDECYTRRVAGFASVSEFYKHHSSANYIDGVNAVAKNTNLEAVERIQVPMLFVNAEDDPLVHVDLFDIPKSFVDNPNKRSIFVQTKHGGHLGFFEGGVIFPSRVTWMDRLVVQYANGITQLVQA